MNQGKRVGDSTSVAGRQLTLRPENLLNVEANNITGGALYVLLFDNPAQTGAPAGGTIASDGFLVQANQGGVLGTPRFVDTCYAAWSSTYPNYTAVGASGSIIGIIQG